MMLLVNGTLVWSNVSSFGSRLTEGADFQDGDHSAELEGVQAFEEREEVGASNEARHDTRDHRHFNMSSSMLLKTSPRTLDHIQTEDVSSGPRRVRQTLTRLEGRFPIMPKTDGSTNKYN